jgi:hypothetical protein
MTSYHGLRTKIFFIYSFTIIMIKMSFQCEIIKSLFVKKSIFLLTSNKIDAKNIYISISHYFIGIYT